MNIEQRKAFMDWVKTHCDYEDLSAYELEIMQDAWQASANRDGYKFVPVEPTEAMLEASLYSQWDDLSSPLENMDALKYKAMIGAVE